MSDKLYVVYGAGKDAMGLVERISAGIAGAGGNIIDMRQDVLHGLFTLYLVAEAGTSLSELRSLVQGIGEATGLDLHVARYMPSRKTEEARHLLLTLVGRDRPGIVAAVSQDLWEHKINIEFSRMIAREGIFLMELLTDVSHASLPRENLENVVRQHLADVGIACTFQQRNVFNPRKRIVLFDIGGSLLSHEQLSQLRQQAGLQPEDLSLAEAAQRVEGLPMAAFERIVGHLKCSHESTELTRTLKRMGYRVALLTRAFEPIAEFAREHLHLDYAFGAELQVDEDSQTLRGTVVPAETRDSALHKLIGAERVDPSEVLVLGDEPHDTSPPGLRLELDTRLVLDLLNQRVLSHESLSGIVGGFGALR